MNDEMHWAACYICSAPDYTTVEYHEFDNDCDTACDCGYTRRTVHDYSVIGYDNTYHWTECSICEKINELVKFKHNFDNTCDTDCSCGYERAITHSYDGSCDDECNVCGKTRTVSAAHVYENSCDKDCIVCGEVRTTQHTYTNACDVACDVCYESRTPAAHTGGNATCTEKAVCSVCGAKYGELGAHVYGSELKYDNDYHWNECACGSKNAAAAHSDADNNGKCDACGYSIPGITVAAIDNGISTGALVAIVIVIVAVGGIGGFTLFWFVLRKRK